MSLLSSSLVVTMHFCFVCELACHMKKVTNPSGKVIDDSIYPVTLGLDGGIQDVRGGQLYRGLGIEGLEK